MSVIFGTESTEKGSKTTAMISAGIKKKLVRMEKIKCPECKKIQEAKHEATTGWPYFSILVHECACGFIIGESEWEVVK
jgi:C4-type Zn-finger protein